MSETANGTKRQYRKLCCKALKYSAGNQALIKSIVSSAGSVIPGEKGDKVYIKVDKIGSKLQGSVYTTPKMNDSDKVLFIKEADQEQSSDPQFGTFGLLDEIYDITKGSYDAYITGKQGMTIIIEVSEKETISKVRKAASASKADALLSSGLSQESLDERIAVLESYGISEKSTLYDRILSKIGKQPDGEEISRPIKLYKDSSKKVMMDALSMISRGHCIILQGPKSVGKNVLWETISYLLNSRIYMLQCNGRMTYANMYGSTGTDNSSKNGITKERAKAFLSFMRGSEEDNSFDMASEFMESMAMSMSPTLTLSPGPVTEALLHAAKGYGAILLLDEMNLSDPNTLSGAMNALTDGHTKQVYVKDLGNVPISPSLIVGATQNGVGGNYLGTRQQNDATMSRLNCIVLENPSTIESILRQVPDVYVEDEVYITLNKVFREFSNLTLSGVSESCMNIRGFERALECISDGMDIKKALEYCVINTVPGEDDIQSLTQMLDNLL